MIVYGNQLSPFVRKVLAFAAEKGQAVELVAAGMGGGPPEFFKASPFGKMPGFQDGDFLISDSTAIVAYLEAVKPDPNLIPAEPKARARTIWYEEYADTVLVECVGKIFFNRVVAPKFLGQAGDLAAADAAQQDLVPRVTDYLEGVVPPSGFLVEDRITLADIAVATQFQNLALGGCPIDAARHPKTAAYVNAILARPSFSGLVAQDRAMLGL